MKRVPDAELRALADLARRAGEAILEVFSGDFSVTRKLDASPLTAADLAAQRVILAGLDALAPGVPVVSEEAVLPPWEERRHWRRYFLVDPLDGTREFVKRNGEFTVNIALVEDHQPALGVVLAPVDGSLYLARRGGGVWLQQAPALGEGQAEPPWQPLRTRPLAHPPVVAGSRSHGADTHAMLADLLGTDYVALPLGSSLKFCLIARGQADLYLRLGETSEWDTAAAQCVLEEAGGAVLDLTGRPLRYNTRDSLTNPEFLAVGDTGVDWPARLRHAQRERY